MTTIAIRTVIIYIFLMLAMRIMGKRQLGELQPAELVVTLLIADVAAVPMQDVSTPLLSGIIPVLMLIALELVVSMLMMKFPTISRLVSGNPIVVVQNGIPDESAMAKLRLTVEDLMDTLRSQGIYDMQDIRTAVAETNGTISVIPTRASTPPTCEDCHIDVKEDTTMYLLISDGRRCRWTYPLCDISDKEIDRALEKRHIAQKDVLLMTGNQRKEFYIIPKERRK